MVHPGSITAVIMWENRDSGNVPFEKFEIQSQTDGKYFMYMLILVNRVLFLGIEAGVKVVAFYQRYPGLNRTLHFMCLVLVLVAKVFFRILQLSFVRKTKQKNYLISYSIRSPRATGLSFDKANYGIILVTVETHVTECSRLLNLATFVLRTV